MLRFTTPKNFKNGRYIFGVYRWRDFIMNLVVTMLSLVLFVFVIYMSDKPNMVIILLVILPIAIVWLMTAPVPNYHNVYEALTIAIENQFSPKEFLSEGFYDKDVFSKES